MKYEDLPPKAASAAVTRRLKKGRLLAIVVLAGLAVWLGASAFVAWKFTRRDRALFPEPPPQVEWAKVEEHRLETADGEEIGAWLVRGDPTKAGVLLLHGNACSRSDMLPVVRLLTEARFSVLAVSLRAHGDSTGQVNDYGWSARYDVAAAVALLKRECPGQRIYVLGRSLGAAAAIFDAEELGTDVAGYFLEQPYKDLDTAVWNRLRYRLPPGFDWLAYLGLRLWAPVFLGVNPARISPYDHIEDIPRCVPVMILTGSADRHTRLDQVMDLYERAGSRAQIVVFDGAVHEALDQRDPERYRTTLIHFIEGSR